MFSGFPYFERFYPSEAEGIFRSLVNTDDSIVLVATRGETQVVGFGASIPLPAKPAVAAHLHGLVPVKHTFYLAELGVLEPYRSRKLGRIMVRERLKLIDEARYSHVVLRVSMNHTPLGRNVQSDGIRGNGRVPRRVPPCAPTAKSPPTDACSCRRCCPRSSLD